MKDLDYFYEKDLDKTNIKDFYDSLPSSLQYKFNAANHTKITWGSVLQGYRGPSHFCNNGSGDSETLDPSHGLQEIKFWWGARKDLNSVPAVGTLIFGLGRVVQTFSGQLEWSSLFFDNKTGECLSHTRNEAAEKLDDIGRKLFKEGKYAEAAEYFDNAYYSCSSGYTNEALFKEYRDHAKAEASNKEADSAKTAGRYSYAIAKYQEAQTDCPSNKTDSVNKFKSNEVEAFNAWGDSLFDKGRYEEALEKYNEAYQKCTTDYNNRDLFKRNRSKAQIETNGKQLYDEGEALYQSEAYEEAKIKYSEAIHVSVINKEQYQMTGVKKAQVEIDAKSLNKKGNLLFANGDFKKAKDKYQEAYSKSAVAKKNDGFFRRLFFRPHEFKTNRDKAQIEVDAIEISYEGDILFKKQMFAEALIKYKEACNKSIVNKETFNACIEKTNAKLDTTLLIEIYNNVIEEFQNMISAGITDNKLKDLRYKLDGLMDTEQYGNNSDIVVRFHAVSLRIARKEMNSHLKSTNQENLNDFKAAIMNSITTEISILKLLDITDEKLEQELISLEEELNVLNDEEDEDEDNALLDLESIAIRVEEINVQVENIVMERLSQNIHCEVSGSA